MPILFFKSLALLSIFLPKINISPLVGVKSPQIIFIVVLFPAPFGPRNPKTCPSLTAKFMLLTAVFCPNFFSRFFISTIFIRSSPL